MLANVRGQTRFGGDRPKFELGETLEQVEGGVKSNHPHCVMFCILGGVIVKYHKVLHILDNFLGKRSPNQITELLL